MPRIDAHQHFWNYDPRVHSWMTADMQVLKQDFGPANLAPLLKECGIDGCVAVQASQTEAENNFLLEAAGQVPIVKGIVGWVDLQADNLPERLEHYKKHSLIKGFRHVLHDEADDQFMLRPAFLRGIGALQQFGYTYDILIFPKHLPYALKMVEMFPEQRFVIDHIAKPAIKAGKKEPWKTQMEALAACPNVFCKISGMVTEADWQTWTPGQLVPYMDAVVDLFGTKRIMYGSDWPVCTLAGSYSRVYHAVQQYFSTYNQHEQDSFFGLNAVRFYNL